MEKIGGKKQEPVSTPEIPEQTNLKSSSGMRSGTVLAADEKHTAKKSSGVRGTWEDLNKWFIKRKKGFNKLIRSKSVKDYFQDYCTSTSIHGIRYLGEPGRPISERLCWVVIFIICFCLNGYLIQQVWKKWNDSPVIVSFAETTTPVWNVPFPAITICSEVKSMSKKFNFTYYMKEGINDTDEEVIKKLGNLSLICDDHVLIPNVTDYADRSTINFLMEVSPPFNEVVSQCYWKGNEKNCASMFSKILTQEGFCYTFNMLDKADLLRGDPFPDLDVHGKRRKGWSLHRGYEEDAPLNSYPLRALSAGAKSGLTIQMRSRTEDKDFYCRGPVLGFKVLLHNPAEFPLIADRYFRSPLNQGVIVVVQPNIMTTSNSLLAYPPHTRQCYFPSERYLSYFKVYTQSNCELECLTNFTQQYCGCVSLYMPRSGKTKICGAGKKSCTVEAAEKLRMNEIYSSYQGLTSSSCDCLPACTSIQYTYENSQATFDYNLLSEEEEDENSTIKFQESRIFIFFKDMQFTTSRRSELFGIVDFMANCGGLLGLCCGMSVLSVLELLYYITLRIWINFEEKNKEKKKKQKEVELKPRTTSATEKKEIEYIDCERHV